MRIRVLHAIDYRFHEPIAHASLEILLSPRPEQPGVRHHQVLVEPHATSLERATDAYGNVTLHALLGAPTSALSVSALTTLELRTALNRPELDPDLAVQLRRIAPSGPPRARSGACRELSERTALAVSGLGLGCRFVSGYLLDREGPTDLHMWVSIDLGPSGWLDWDPILSRPADAHLALALGSRADDVAAVQGTLLASGRYRMVSRVEVERL